MNKPGSGLASFGVFVIIAALLIDVSSWPSHGLVMLLAAMIIGAGAKVFTDRPSDRELQERSAREQEEENRRRLIAEANARLEEPLPRDASPLEERLRRGERTVQEWVADIRSLTGGSNRGFRQPSIPPDALWSIVEDEGADAGARVAAAIALRAHEGEVAQERLRVAVQTAESPTLRIAIAAAEETKEEDLVKLLDALDDP